MSRTCDTCRININWCVCHLKPRLKSKTDICLVIHALDHLRASNTGRQVHEVLAQSRLVIHGTPSSLTDLDKASKLWKNPHILFPGHRSKPMDDKKLVKIRSLVAAENFTLIVPDGNWNQTNHMLKRIPHFAGLPVLELTPEQLMSQSMRQNRMAYRMSTFEAVAKFLGLVECESLESELLEYLNQFVSRMLMMRGKINKYQLPKAFQSR